MTMNIKIWYENLNPCLFYVCFDCLSFTTLEFQYHILYYCKNKYGDRSRIPTYNELQKVIGKINPLNKIKIVKGYTPEWTSTVDPNDNDDYKVFFKTKEQKQDYRSIYPEGKGVYVDADTDGGLAFRCYIEIN